MRQMTVFATILTFAALFLSACADDEANGNGEAPATTTTTNIEGTAGSSSGATEVPVTPSADVPTPEGTQAPTEIPLADGPPPLEVDGTFLGLGNYCWAMEGADEVCDEQDGVVTSAAVLSTRSGESINVTGFGQLDPLEASAQLWTRPESGESQGANRTIWERTGDPIEVPVTPGTDAIAVTTDAAPGSYLLDLTVTYEEGAVEYGLQVDVE